MHFRDLKVFWIASKVFSGNAFTRKPSLGVPKTPLKHTQSAFDLSYSGIERFSYDLEK